MKPEYTITPLQNGVNLVQGYWVDELGNKTNAFEQLIGGYYEAKPAGTPIAELSPAEQSVLLNVINNLAVNSKPVDTLDISGQHVMLPELMDGFTPYTMPIPVEETIDGQLDGVTGP
jgi:hypothetical protein